MMPHQAAWLALLTLLAPAAPREPLHLTVFVADSASFHVTSTLIYGPTEALLVDAQYHNGEAAKLADLIQSTGRHLTAIFISHPDDDHYFGLAVLRQRFPDAPIYMTAPALAEFQRTSARYLAAQRSRLAGELPDSLPVPQLLPSPRLRIDGESVEVVTDLQGDAFVRSNSFVWIPSLRAVVAGDLVFNGVHPWLANSTPRTRAAWRSSLEWIAGMQARVVVAGHKSGDDAPDDPAAVAFTRKYLAEFDRAAAEAPNADAFVAAMTRKYSTLGLPNILRYAARQAVPN